MLVALLNFHVWWLCVTPKGSPLASGGEIPPITGYGAVVRPGTPPCCGLPRKHFTVLWFIERC